jgi:cyclophilin family peptidyl-prolyl cis-trans isomerase
MKRFMMAAMAMLSLAGVAEAKEKLKKQDFVVQTVAVAPAPTPEDTLVLQISTGGTVRVQLRPDKAPRHVARYKGLTRAGFYDGLLFHRVIDGFMAQTGDPKGTGEGGSSLPDMTAEFNDLPHMRGAISAARTDAPNTANSQFFLVFQPVLRLDTRYTVFGRVLSGMEFVDAIERGEPPTNPSRIVKAWIEADGPDAPRRPLPTVEEEAAIAPLPAAAPVVAEGPVQLPKAKKKKKFLGVI